MGKKLFFRPPFGGGLLRDWLVPRVVREVHHGAFGEGEALALVDGSTASGGKLVQVVVVTAVRD